MVSDPARVKLVYLHVATSRSFSSASTTARPLYERESMLRSQFEALELPRDALTLDVAQPPENFVADIRATLAGC